MADTHLDVPSGIVEDELLGDVVAVDALDLGVVGDVEVGLPVPLGGVRVGPCRRRVRHPGRRDHPGRLPGILGPF